MARPVLYDRDHPPTTQPEIDGFQLIAEGLNRLGYAHRKQLKRRSWHRVTLWVRWPSRREAEISDLLMVEDRSYGTE